ncbi:hypothetical protein RSJ42_02900 [Methanosarcina hadiensis]|uniref:hypothetical protein n=1 Tax=Methanosarcina hadiensis TaxID=3078083 RepID=UPI0039772612
MKNHFTIFFLLTVICISVIISGCTENYGKNNSELNETTEEESRQVAEAYVRDLDSYKTCNLTEPLLMETRNLNCSSCWQFIYRFDLVSEKDPSVVDTATVTVTVVKGEIIDAIYVQGGRY